MDAELVGLAIALIVAIGLDAVACAIPISFVKNDLERLGCTPNQMRVIPAVKLLTVAGLVVGLWVPWIGAAACIGMIIYFGFAFGFHARAKDVVAKYLPAAGFAAFFAAVLVLSYLPAI